MTRFLLLLVLCGLSAAPRAQVDLPPLRYRMVPADSLVTVLPVEVEVSGRVVRFKREADTVIEGRLPFTRAVARDSLITVTVATMPYPGTVSPERRVWEEPDTVAVGGRRGLLRTGHYGASLVVRASDRRSLVVESRDTTRAPLIAVAEAVDVERLRTLSVSDEVFTDPMGETLFLTEAAYARRLAPSPVWVSLPTERALRDMVGDSLRWASAHVTSSGSGSTAGIRLTVCRDTTDAASPTARERRYSWFNPTYVCGFGMDTSPPDPGCLTIRVGIRQREAVADSAWTESRIGGRPALLRERLGEATWHVPLGARHVAWIQWIAGSSGHSRPPGLTLAPLDAPWASLPFSSDSDGRFAGALARDSVRLLAQVPGPESGLIRVDLPPSWTAFAPSPRQLHATPEGPLGAHVVLYRDVAASSGLVVMGGGIRPDELLDTEPRRFSDSEGLTAWLDLFPVGPGRPIAVPGSPAAAERTFRTTLADGRRLTVIYQSWIRPGHFDQALGAVAFVRPEKEPQAREWLAKIVSTIRVE